METPDRDALNQLIASYERLATSQDARADLLLELGMRIGWDDQSMRNEAELRQGAEASRMLAQEVRDGMAE
jgi:hypothetical protein